MMNRRVLLSTVAAGALTAFASPIIAQSDETTAMEIKPMIQGAETATVTLVEYASYTCPHCATFHRDIYPKLKSDFIDTGKIKFEMREVYFDRLGLWAGMLARCGGDDKYFGLADLLFKRQREWTSGNDSATVAENLYKIGRIAGMNDTQMEGCLQNREHAEALVATYQKNATADNVRATPSLLIDGELLEYNSYEELSELINKAIG